MVKRAAWADEDIPTDLSGMVTGLYLGNATTAANEEWLCQKGIRMVVNVAAEVHLPRVGSRRQLNLGVRRDGGIVDFQKVFKTAAALVEEVLNAGESVLINCAHGRNR